jgi:ABC-type branched-subunit amino acid transport system permease subunit
MGVNVNRTISFTFALAGGLAGVGGLLYLIEFNIRYDTGFELGLIAFTAAVLGGNRNLPGAVLGGIIIGLIQAFNEGLTWLAPGSDWTRSIVFGLLIAILVFRPEGLLGERTPEGPEGPARAVAARVNARHVGSRSDRPRRGGAQWRGPAAHPRWIPADPLALAITTRSTSTACRRTSRHPDASRPCHVTVTILVFVVMAVGLNVVVGYAGLLDLGYVAFYAIGAYTAGWLASGQFQQVHFHFGSSGRVRRRRHPHLDLARAADRRRRHGVGGILIGLPDAALRGDYLAIVTLGFGEIIPQFVRNADHLHGFDLTHGTFGNQPDRLAGLRQDAAQRRRLP